MNLNHASSNPSSELIASEVLKVASDGDVVKVTLNVGPKDGPLSDMMFRLTKESFSEIIQHMPKDPSVIQPSPILTLYGKRHAKKYKKDILTNGSDHTATRPHSQKGTTTK